MSVNIGSSATHLKPVNETLSRVLFHLSRFFFNVGGSDVYQSMHLNLKFQYFFFSKIEIVSVVKPGVLKLQTIATFVVRNTLILKVWGCFKFLLSVTTILLPWNGQILQINLKS